MRIGLIAAVLIALASPAFADQPGFHVIVHPANPAVSVDKKFLAEVFLKKKTRWPHEEVVKPVDASSRSAIRARFSVDVLKRPVAAVRRYWQQIVFSGRGVPPPELENEEAIVSYVLKHKGAIGYVSASANLNGAKVLQVR
jgi:hypothetical protein